MVGICVDGPFGECLGLVVPCVDSSFGVGAGVGLELAAVDAEGR